MASTRQLQIELFQPKANKKLSILRLKGFVNARSNRDMEGALDAVLEKEKSDVVIDLGELSYLNSTGLATLINFHRAFRDRDRELVLVKVPRHVGVVMHQMGLMEVIPVLRDEAEAQDYLSRSIAGLRSYSTWGDYLEKSGGSAARKETFRPSATASRSGAYSVLVVEPQVDEFVQVLKIRLQNPQARFTVVHGTAEALAAFKELQPEIVIIRHAGAESDELVRKMKIDLARPLVSVVMIYASGSDLERPMDFKIWENDFFVEPFDIMELFTLSESEIQRVWGDRQRARHQLNFRFLTEDSHIAKASELAEHLVRQSPLREESATKLLSAYSEAVDNARRHGHLDTAKSLEVVFAVDEKSVSFQVTDSGEGFDHKSWTRDVQDTTAVKRAQKAQSQGRKGGLGILLMCKCCTRVNYLGSGNIVLLEQDIDS